jgi:hypothetical protein
MLLPGCFADPLYGLSHGVTRVRFLKGLPHVVERGRFRLVDMETIDNLLWPPQLEGDAKLVVIFCDKSGELARLDRYERRALSRGKNAIRAYNSARLSPKI